MLQGGTTMTEITTLRPLVPALAAPGDTEILPHNIEAEQQLLGAILTNNDILRPHLFGREGGTFL